MTREVKVGISFSPRTERCTAPFHSLNSADELQRFAETLSEDCIVLERDGRPPIDPEAQTLERKDH